MSGVDPRQLAAAERLLAWSVRSCFASLAVTAIAFVLAVLDFGGRDQTLLAAIGLMVCFIGVFFAFVGLFGLALARERQATRSVPAWLVPWSVGAILADFAIGLFGMLT